MITKERLEELKKDGAIVWQIKNNEEFNIALPIKLNYVTIKYLEEGIEVKSDVYMLFKISEAYDRIYFIRYDELTEDEEEANFINRYQGITRTETLNLPTWEEIQKRFENNNKFGGHLIVEFDDVQFMVFIGNYSKKFIKLTNQPRKSLTKENYLKACEKCRKLFLREEEV